MIFFPFFNQAYRTEKYDNCDKFIGYEISVRLWHISAYVHKSQFVSKIANFSKNMNEKYERYEKKYLQDVVRH